MAFGFYRAGFDWHLFLNLYFWLKVQFKQIEYTWSIYYILKYFFLHTNSANLLTAHVTKQWGHRLVVLLTYHGSDN